MRSSARLTIVQTATMLAKPRRGALARTKTLRPYTQQADHVRWQQPRPRRLIGIHALLGLDEATLVAVPDAVHRGWSAEQVVPPASLEAPKLRATADASGAWQLAWNTVDPQARYVLEQSETPDFSAPSVILAAAGATTYALAPPMQAARNRPSRARAGRTCPALSQPARPLWCFSPSWQHPGQFR